MPQHSILSPAGLLTGFFIAAHNFERGKKSSVGSRISSKIKRNQSHDFSCQICTSHSSPRMYELIPIRKGVAYAAGHSFFACPLAALRAGQRS
jgi:hypothetical protein